MRKVSLMTANQEFSRLVREVEQGEDFVITRRGRPVARLSPHKSDAASDAAWEAAHRRMMARMKKGASLKGLRVDRDSLYDR